MGVSKPEEWDLHNIEHSAVQLSVTDDRIEFVDSLSYLLFMLKCYSSKRKERTNRKKQILETTKHLLKKNQTSTNYESFQTRALKDLPNTPFRFLL